MTNIDAKIKRLRELCDETLQTMQDFGMTSDGRLSSRVHKLCTALPTILAALVETRKALRHCVRDHEINNNFHIAQCAACRLVADMPATC